MTKFHVGAVLALMGMFGLPFISSAATYHYVDITGTVRDIEAPSAAMALSAVTALPNTLHTGIAIDHGFIESGDDVGQDYWYRNTQGGISMVHAATLDAAYLIAIDRDPSGMMYTR